MYHWWPHDGTHAHGPSTVALLDHQVYEKGNPFKDVCMYVCMNVCMYIIRTLSPNNLPFTSFEYFLVIFSWVSYEMLTSGSGYVGGPHFSSEECVFLLPWWGDLKVGV